MLKKTVLILLALALIGSVSVFANHVPPYTPNKTFWVDASYGGGGSTGTAAKPFTTIQAAINKAADGTNALTLIKNFAAGGGAAKGFGHIIVVKSGTYNESISINHADLENLWIMSYASNPDSVIVQSGAAGTAAITIVNNKVKVSGIQFRNIANQTASLVAVPGTASKGADFMFYNCIFDQNNVTAGQTNGLVDLTLAAAVTHTVAPGAAKNTANFENCTFDLTDGGATGITLAGASLHTGFEVKGCTFYGKSDQSSIAIKQLATGRTDYLYVLGNDFQYTKIQLNLPDAVPTAADRHYIRGNNFELTDGIEIIFAAYAGGGAASMFANGLFIEGNHFQVNNPLLVDASRRANGFALKLNGTCTQQFADANLNFNYNSIIQKQKTGDTSATVWAITNAGGGATANAFAAAKTANNWWGDDAGPGAITTADARASITPVLFTAPVAFWTNNSANIPGLDNSKGIEIFDIDHNGFIDKAVVYFTKRINPISVPDYTLSTKEGLNIGSGYVITRATVETTDATCQAMAIYFNEKTDAFDTGVQPQVTFTQANDTDPKLAGLAGIAVSAIPTVAGPPPSNWGSYLTTEQSATWTELAAAEVDKANPVLIKAETQDEGYGTGFASNGFLDAIKFTFSEQIQGVRAAALREGTPDTDYELNSGNGAVAVMPDSNIVVFAGDISFNQGSKNLTAGTNVYTLAVGEIRLNTGLTPTVYLRMRDDTYINGATNLDVISDFAKSATGAEQWNTLWVSDVVEPVLGNVDGDEFPVFVLDAAPLVVASVQTADTQPNGKIDRITVNFSENVESVGFTSAATVKFFDGTPFFGSGAAPDGNYTFNAAIGGGVTINGSVMTFTVAENAVATPVYDTEAKPQFRYARTDTDANRIKDLAGVQLANYGSNISGGKIVATTDGAAPVIVKMITRDAYTDSNRVGASNYNVAGPDGRLDGVDIVFSEKVMTDNGAQNKGTPLDNAEAQFAVTATIGATNFVKTVLTAATTQGPNAPTWTDADNTGDTASTMYIPFQAVSYNEAGLTNNGDTGATIAITYTAAAAANQLKDYANNVIVTTPLAGASTDGAAPFIVQGVGRGWRDNAFSNITTVDSDSTIIGNTVDTASGNGYVDGFQLKFTEAVTFQKGSTPANFAVYNLATQANSETALAQFTTTLPGDNKLNFKSGGVSAITSDTIIIYGRPNYKGVPNTEIAPLLTYAKDDAVMRVVDAAGNKLPAFTDRMSTDGAKPVIVSVNQNGDVLNQVLVTFSEVVSGHYTGTVIKANLDSLQIPSNQLFGYDNINAKDVVGFGATYVKRVVDNERQLIATLLGNLTADDIKNDKVWLKDTGLFDNIDDLETALVDNEAKYVAGGTDIKVKFYDDVVLPWIYSAQTIDADGNGNIDHIKFVMSENVKSSTINGYVADNAMGNDVAAVYILSGYTGTAKFNFFFNTDAGKTAAAAAGKPVFESNAKDKQYLYLEIEEAGVPKYTVTGLGSTGWAPTLTYGIAGNAPTLKDMSARANPLDKTPNADETAKPFFKEGDAVADAVGPVLMKAEWANSKINLYFSEAIADVGSVYNCYHFMLQDMNKFTATFTPAKATSQSEWTLTNDDVVPGFCRKLTGMTWTNAGIVALTVDPSIFPVDAKMGIQILSNPTIPSGTTGLFKDGRPDTQTPAGPNVSKKYLYTKNYKSTIGYAEEICQEAKWYTVGNTFCPYPFDQVWQKDFLQLVPIDGLKSLVMTEPGAINKMTGQTVDVKWKSVGIDNVDVYKSTDNGATYTKIATVPAADGKYVWTVEAGVDYLSIQSAAEGEEAYKSKSGLITVTIDEFAPVLAAANLTVTDVPNDNGRWFVAKFKPSATTTVSSYQFYRKDKPAGAADSIWVYFAVVPKVNAQADGFCYVMVPTPKNGVFKYTVAASTGSVVSAFASKEGEIAVADLVSEEAAKEAATIVSDFSEYAIGGAEDNIAPSAVSGAVAADNDGAGTGIKVSWTNPTDHGVVGYIKISDVQIPIYGAEGYNVYRKAVGADDFVLAGTAPEAATSYVDMVADGTTVYEYIVKATDGTFEVAATVPGLAMAGNGTADFNNDGAVSLGDLVLLGNMWGKKSTDASWIVNYDLNKDNSVGLGDLVLLGNQWTGAKKSAKSAPMPGIALDMTAELNEATSMYYVTVGSKDALEGLAFTMKYDTNLYEFVKESVTGTGIASVANETKAGVIDIASVYGNENFSGAITLGFKSKGKTGDMNIELANAEVQLNGVLGSVNDQTVTLKALPTVYTLAQNFPNPFNPTTTIEYSIPTAGNTTLAIYNLAGQKIRTLVNNVQAPSFYKVVWDGKNDNGMTVATGTYFYKLISGNYSKIVKMTLIK